MVHRDGGKEGVCVKVRARVVFSEVRPTRETDPVKRGSVGGGAKFRDEVRVEGTLWVGVGDL